MIIISKEKGKRGVKKEEGQRKGEVRGLVFHMICIVSMHQGFAFQQCVLQLTFVFPFTFLFLNVKLLFPFELPPNQKVSTADQSSSLYRCLFVFHCLLF